MFAKKSISRIFSVFFIIIFMLAVTPLRAARAAGVRYATPGGTGDCSNWANACTLQTALTGALSGDEIWVQAGTYMPITGTNRTATFQLKVGVALYGGFAGTETARNQRNPATHLTTLSGEIGTPGDSDNSIHVVTGATFATLDGFTITAGNADGASPNNSGGGMYNYFSNPALANVTFSGNTAANKGGGMYNESSWPTLANVTFSGNTAANEGGGMVNWDSSSTLTNVTFSGNVAANEGGGMSNWQSSPTLTNVTFSGNSAYFGGGMFNSVSSGPTLTNATFSGNSAKYGGGMYNDSSVPTLTNVTFSGNSAINDGGGMSNESSSDPTLTNVTFSGNTAGSNGGGMFNGPFCSPMIRNTIFWGNTAPWGAQIYDYDSIPSVSYSVVQDGYAGGTHIITTDPRLGTLGNYGGFTQTIPLLANSSAIDAGDDSHCPATDQRGVSRPQGAHCDIGAFEGVIYSNYLPLIMKH